MIRHLLAAACRPSAATVVICLSLAGCGGAAAQAVSPQAEAAKTAASPAVSVSSADDLTTAAGAAAAVDQAERTIDQLLGPTQSRTISQQGAWAQPPEPPPPPPPPPAGSSAPRAKDARPEAPADAGGTAAPSADHRDGLKRSVPAQPESGDACTTACTALASMERAAEHLCTLAGAGDDRCTSARTRVKNASTRVHASCPACRG